MSGQSRLMFPWTQEEGQSPMPGAFPQAEPEPFKPEPIDVAIVKIMLSKGMKIPPELVDIIIDHAEYWACTEVSMEFKGANAVRIRGRPRNAGSEDKLLLRTPPIGFTETAVSDIGSWTAAEPRFQRFEPPPDNFTALLKTPPSLEHPVRKIVFKIKARDQGWGGNSNDDHNSFRGSWTWFEAGLERFDGNSISEGPESPLPFQAETLRTVHPVVETTTNAAGVHVQFPLNPSNEYTVQRNRTASRPLADYEVVWSWTDATEPGSLEAERLDEQGRGSASGNGDFVRSLKLGDVVTLWGKARFPGWANNVESASVAVYWAM